MSRPFDRRAIKFFVDKTDPQVSDLPGISKLNLYVLVVYSH